MPELPDVEVYVEALRERVLDTPLGRVLVSSPFLLRTVEPPLEAVEGKKVLDVRRVGKRIAFRFADDLYLVLHLMIAGRLHWESKKPGLARFEFDRGTLTLSEAGSKKRASLHVLRALPSPGLEPMEATSSAFEEALKRENHTLKRALTDPRIFSGIGNAYSDEILHRAKLSPLAMTSTLKDIEGLRKAAVDVLREAIDRLTAERKGGFPEGVTAFRPWHAVHGKFKKPCPVCGAPVRRIVYAENETNYCARCQTGGKLLADRALSRLLKGDWPKTLDET